MKGFSLIEMLIVLVVICVLAILAVPRYREMTARAENASALSDLKNLVVTEVAFLGDWQQYGRSNNSAAVAVHGVGAFLIGPGTQQSVIASPDQFVVLGISNGVHLIVSTNAVKGLCFVGMTKHFLGTRIFAVDSNVGCTRYQPGIKDLSLAASGVSFESSENDNLPPLAGWQDL